ncbi:MAG TPA: sigma-70 family RNA polymerase sigma factor [Polyangia bacterium]|nr:sigma-70 family RNA polymerase sigma factor [Polyangia bacterium]
MERQQRTNLQRCLTRLADGDRDAFRVVFDLAWPRAREIAHRLLPAADAEDAAQTALLKLFERANEFDPARDALAWIVGIVSFECLTFRKKAARRREAGAAALPVVADATANPEEQTINGELEAVALATLGNLRPEDRETLGIAFFGEGARAVKPATFRKRLERALVRLRAAWRDHGIG